MKEQDEAPEKQLSEVEIGSLSGRKGGERLKTERGKILPSFLIVLGVVIR